MRGYLRAQPFFIGQAGRTAFQPGMADAEEFPFVQWSRILARRAAAGRESLFGTYDVLRSPPLRDEIANYLNAARGMRCSPEQVVVTTGAQGAFDLLARLLINPGDAAWMEEPGYFGAQAAFALAGGKLLPLPRFARRLELRDRSKADAEGHLCHALLPPPFGSDDADRAASSSARERGADELETHDKLGALLQLARVLRLPAPDATPASTTFTNNTQVNVVGDMPALEVARRLAFVLERAVRAEAAPALVPEPSHAPGERPTG